MMTVKEFSQDITDIKVYLDKAKGLSEDKYISENARKLVVSDLLESAQTKIAALNALYRLSDEDEDEYFQE